MAISSHYPENLVNESVNELTGSHNTNPFYGRSKIKNLEKLKKNPSKKADFMASLATENADIDESVDILRDIIYNQSIFEKAPWGS